MEAMKCDTFAIMLSFFFFFFFFLRVDVVSKSSRFDTRVCIILFKFSLTFVSLRSWKPLASITAWRRRIADLNRRKWRQRFTMAISAQTSTPLNTCKTACAAECVSVGKTSNPEMEAETSAVNRSRRRRCRAVNDVRGSHTRYRLVVALPIESISESLKS